MVKRFWNILVSRGLAIALLVLASLILAVGAVLPNPDLLGAQGAATMKTAHPLAYWLGERYNSQKIAGGYVFGFIGVFLVVITGLCSIDRVLGWFTLRGKAGRFGQVSRFTNEHLIPLGSASPTDTRDYAMRWLRAHGWPIVIQEDQHGNHMLVAAKGNKGFWGSVLFHGVLITALVGMVIYQLGAYRADLSFTEGQYYELTEDRLVSVSRRPFWGLSLPRVGVGLEGQRSIFDPRDPWTATDHVATFRIVDLKRGTSWTKDVRINDPLVINGTMFVLQTGGFSPRFVVQDRQGVSIIDSFVALRPKEGEKDRFVLRDSTFIQARVLPDFAMDDGKATTRGMEPKNPVVDLTLVTADGTSHEAVCPIGSVVEVGGYRIAVPVMKRWVLLQMVGEPGLGGFFWLCIAGIAGVAIRIMDPDERIRIVIRQEGRGSKMSVDSYSRHFSSLLEERVHDFIGFIEERGVYDAG